MVLATKVLNAAKAKGIRIALAESCTGGMVSVMLTDVAGSSAVFDRGFVTYTNKAKQDLLAVRPETLQAFGAVSPETAAEMARGALDNSAADIALSITGIAGPGGSEFKPEGRVCFGLATKDAVQSETVDFGALGRGEVRKSASLHGLQRILDALINS